MNKRRWMTAAAVGGLVLGMGRFTASAQSPGVAETLGQKIDGVGRGLSREAVKIGDTMRRTFENMRTEVNRMNAPARVYSRLHWDRALHTSKIEVHPIRGGGVLLRGTVADTAARERAVAIARDTFEVTEVVDELTPLVTTVVPTQAVPPVIGGPATLPESLPRR